MTRIIRRTFLCSALCAALWTMAVSNMAVAQTTDLDLRRLPWDLVAETMDFDGKTSTTIYTGIKFTQGNISIESDEGRATVDQNNSGSWSFSGNVVIDVNTGKIECDAAELSFDGNILTNAVVTGTPATFVLQRAGADDTTYAEAGTLLYDVQKGIIEFSGQAIITESGNEIASNYLVYNIIERRINADSSGVDDDRVRITYTPTETDESSIDDDDDIAEDSEGP